MAPVGRWGQRRLRLCPGDGPDGTLYAAWSIEAIDGAAASEVARWDGATSSWRALGSGTFDGDVYDLAVGPDGTLYAGGWFTTAGGVAANNIARWDGTRWRPLGSGTYGGDVRALAAAPDGSLYAGGLFTAAGGAAANNIARWDGSAWHALGGGTSGGYVLALTIGTEGSLYAGGSFTAAGGVAANGVARWDGSAWHALGGGTSGGAISALAAAPDGALYAGGAFDTAAGAAPRVSGAAASTVARWDAPTSSWRPLGSGMEGDATRPAHVYALAAGTDGALYAGGSFATAGGVGASNIAAWDAHASSWRPLGTGDGMNGPVLALAFRPDGSLCAGGRFTVAGGALANHVACRPAGSTTWQPLGSGTDGDVYALAAAPDGSLYAGGSFTTAGGVAANAIARWDGTTSSWHALGSGMEGGYGSPTVNALAVGLDGSLYAGGTFDTAGGVPAKYVARWDAPASSWHSLVGREYISWQLRLRPGGRAGRLALCGGSWSTFIRWDGTGWQCLFASWARPPDVVALAAGPDGSIYAGGSWGPQGQYLGTDDFLIRYSQHGTTWSLGGGVGGSKYPGVEALAVRPNGSLYAGGRFTTAGGVTAHHIARWDGVAWHPLGDGMDNHVLALAWRRTARSMPVGSSPPPAACSPTTSRNGPVRPSRRR